jgi:hypothetical protein
MKKVSYPFIFFLLFLIGFPAIQGHILAKSVGKNDDGGILRIGCHQGAHVRNDIEARIRRFVWTHWKEKRKGRIGTTYCGIDTSLKSVFLIKKGAKGEWVVVEKFVESGPWIWSKDRITINTYHYVDRVEIVAKTETPESISEERDRESNSYRLRLGPRI